MQQRPDSIDHGAPRLDIELTEAWTTGNADLLKRLIANLVDNAERPNNADGYISVRTAAERDRAVLTVANSGPVVPAAEISRLLLPFQRVTGERTNAEARGHGLGLSIVAAIATAHDATLTIRPGRDGGLDVEASFTCAPRTTVDRRGAADVHSAPV